MHAERTAGGKGVVAVFGDLVGGEESSTARRKGRNMEARVAW